MTDMSERILLAIVALLVALLVGLGFFWNPELPQRLLPKAGMAAGGDFTLQSAGGPVALKDFRGKLVLVYFGYTYCPDVCPTSLAATAAGLKLLEADEAGQVAMIFVSVDPERDTPARLKEYAEFFHPAIVGVTGTPENLAEIAKRYGVFYARQKVETAGGGYVVDHTSDTYVIGREGQLLSKIAHAAPPDEVAAEIRRRLK
jgi:protein SCO1/2